MNPKDLANRIAAQRRQSIDSLRSVRLQAKQRADELCDKRDGQTKTLESRREEMDLLSRDIPGLFPTPPALAARLVAEALLHPGLMVLEPSAGTGNLAVAIREGGCNPVCVEINYTLVERLRKMGYTVHCQDFLTFYGEFDRVVMNPPFEKGQDIDHVRHAHALLKPKGRLVAIMSQGAFSRNDRKAKDFRDWLSIFPHESEALPPETFKASGTLISSCLVIIDKE